MGGARASYCVRLHIPGGGDTAAHLRRVTEDVISAGRVESAMVYCEGELDASAMALGGLGHHAPVSVERRGNCRRSGTDGCASGRSSDGTDTIADHGNPPVSFEFKIARDAAFRDCGSHRSRRYGHADIQTPSYRLIHLPRGQ